MLIWQPFALHRYLFYRQFYVSESDKWTDLVLLFISRDIVKNRLNERVFLYILEFYDWNIFDLIVPCQFHNVYMSIRNYLLRLNFFGSHRIDFCNQFLSTCTNHWMMLLWIECLHNQTSYRIRPAPHTISDPIPKTICICWSNEKWTKCSADIVTDIFRKAKTKITAQQTVALISRSERIDSWWEMIHINLEHSLVLSCHHKKNVKWHTYYRLLL